jgi:uncharacterized membrane protein YuzA (DUF378 family)
LSSLLIVLCKFLLVTTLFGQKTPLSSLLSIS